MLKLTGDSTVADELELSTLNQSIGMFSSDCTWSTYNTPMDGVRIPSTEDISFQIRKGSEQLNCCSVNAPRGIGMISDWALMKQEGALILNLYGPSTIKAVVKGSTVTLAQNTNYPQSGHIELKVSPTKPVQFALKLRIPQWSKATSLSVNGQVKPCKPGSYAILDRKWRTGDVVSIDLDMSIRFWMGQREAEGKASIYRGPVLFALESVVSEPTFQSGWQKFASLWATRLAGAFVESKFEGDAISWKGFRFDDGGIARISIDGKVVEDVSMFGPGRNIPFAWERSGFGQGSHTIRIEALGKRSAESKDTWINFKEFECAVPELSIERLQMSKFVLSGSGFGSLEIPMGNAPAAHLIDYCSAGEQRRPYRTWLPVNDKTSMGVWPIIRTKPN